MYETGKVKGKGTQLAEVLKIGNADTDELLLK